MSLGTMALPEGGRVDFARLRRDRRQRLAEAMATHGLDALILGRPANIAYASGARQLWVAGARPFGPGAIVIAGTGKVHLLSTWDEGVPGEIGHEELFGLSWNPARLFRHLAAIPGLAQARRIGTDSSSPGFPQAIASVAPEAELLDAGPALAAARATKTPDEVACVETATALAEAALAALVAALRPGVTERQLVGVYVECLAARGVPTPPSEGVVASLAGGVLRQVPTDRPVGPRERVMLNPGALYAGYEGGIGRTWVVGGSRHASPAGRAALDAVIDRCRPGATGRDLRAAWESSGLPLPPVPLAHGLGLGVEAPVVGAGIGDDAVLRPGSVLAVQGWVADGWFERETVLVADDPRILSRH